MYFICIFKRGFLNFLIILVRFWWKIYYREEMFFFNLKKCVNVCSLFKVIIYILINFFMWNIFW